MRLVLNVLIAVLVALHLAFFALEAVLWETDLAAPVRQALRLDEAKEVVGRVGKNQGLCNAFLAVGLAWGVWALRRDRPEGKAVLTFFLGFIVLAGLVGYWSLRPEFPSGLVFLVGQTGLAAAALACVPRQPAVAVPRSIPN